MMETIKQTPFACHDNDLVRYEAVKPNTTVKNIRSLFERRMLSNDDTIILEMFNRYKYLNAHLVEEAAKSYMDSNTNYIKNILTKLLRCGLLVRFRIQYTDTYGMTHSSSYIYSFSERGRKLFNAGTTELEYPPKSKNVFATLAFNQFYIKTGHSYGANIINQVYCIEHPAFDGKLQFMSKGKRITVHVITIRNCEGWTDTLISRLKWQKNSTACHMILVLCETELQALEAEKIRGKLEELTSYNVCYLCDQATAADTNPLDQLIRVSPIKNYSTYELCALTVDTM